MNKKANIFDLYNENFDRVVQDLVNSMTEAQKKMLPEKLLNRLFTNKKNIGSNLEFREKCYILSICFGKRVIVVIEDEKQGLGKKEFELAVEAQKGDITNTELLSYPRTMSSFVMADKNLIQSLTYLNHVYTSEIFSLMRPINFAEKSVTDNKYKLGVDAIKNITKLILSYEAFKKRLVIEFNLKLPEIYALFYFSTGEKLGKDFYEKDFRYSYNANKADMFNGMNRLYKEGYLNRRGSGQRANPLKYTLAAKGLDTLNKILERIVGFYKM